jgi:hypothetical protein
MSSQALLELPQQLLTVGPVQILLQSAECETDHIAMVELRPGRFVGA